MTASRTLHDDIELLGEAIQAQGPMEAFALEERARALGKALRSGDENAREQLTALTAGLSIEEATVLVRAFTSYFRLVNLAEDNERVRRVHTREHNALPAPRRGSLRGDRDHRRSRQERREPAGAARTGRDSPGVDCPSD